MKNQFQADANIMPMMEKVVMQILSKNGLLTGNKTFGVVEEVLNHSTLMVVMQQSGVSEVVNCSPSVTYNLGDRVLIEYINNNPHDRLALGVLKGGSEVEQMDYSLLPEEPVEIIRDEDGKAVKFIYGYDDSATTWTQELVRNEDGSRLESVIYTYPDGFIEIRKLIRGEEDKLEKYE